MLPVFSLSHKQSAVLYYFSQKENTTATITGTTTATAYTTAAASDRMIWKI
jgi:hypothetical protein